MKNRYPLFPLLFSLFLATYYMPLQGQVIFHEDFEGDFETNGWTVDTWWLLGNSDTLSSAYFIIPDHTQFAGVNDDAVGPGTNTSGAIITSEIDLTGVSAALLTFETYFINGDYYADETAKVLVSTDGMATWQELLDLPGISNAWQTIFMPLGEGIAGNKIHLAFDYADDDGWNFGFCVDDILVEIAPDYLAETSLLASPTYTMTTPRQAVEPIYYVHEFGNFGTQDLAGIEMEWQLILDGGGTVDEGTYTLPTVASGASHIDTLHFLPTEIGDYIFSFSASHPELGEGFFERIYHDAFELHPTMMARDDGEREATYGFSFGDPNWYGYYGSEFDLVADDTLTGIMVAMSSSEAGSFNLTVNVKDAEGLPSVELFHSPPIEIGANQNGWVQYELPGPMPMSAGNYVFAVGQDTIQGIMGHGMDESRMNPTYWIVSPVAGGGYDWFNWPEGPTLMIRPIFKEQPIVSSTDEVEVLSELKTYPNPASDLLRFEWDGYDGSPFYLTLTGADGRIYFSEKRNETSLEIGHLAPGIYFLKIQTDEGAWLAKVRKG